MYLSTITLKNFRKYAYDGANKHGITVNFHKGLYTDDEGRIHLSGVNRVLAGKSTNSAISYARAIQRLLSEEGLIRYNDTYRYTLLALKKYGSSLRTLLSRRFQYVFVDEYQDCSTLQRNVLDALFSGTETIFQKIGDVDQAIYNSTNDNTPVWQVEDSYMSIAHSNRYQSSILSLSQIHDFSYSAVEKKVKEIFASLLGDEWLENIPDSFMQPVREPQVASEDSHIFCDYESSISIVFDTVYGVKGETHDATLYLETETKKSSDIRRILPLLERKITQCKNELQEKSRRCVYVGFSPPRPGVKFCVSDIRQKSRMALENRANSGLNPLFTESHGGQSGMRAGTA